MKVGMNKKYLLLGKTLVEMRQACREAVVEEEKYRRIYHTFDNVPEGFPVDVALKRLEAKRLLFNKTLQEIEEGKQ